MERKEEAECLGETLAERRYAHARKLTAALSVAQIDDRLNLLRCPAALRDEPPNAIAAAQPFAVLLQYPGTTGSIRDLTQEIEAAHAIGALAIVAADPLSRFIAANPTVVMLALGFLIMIGMTLIAEGFGAHVPKGYVYTAMAFSARLDTRVGRRDHRRTPAFCQSRTMPDTAPFDLCLTRARLVTLADDRGYGLIEDGTLACRFQYFLRSIFKTL